MMEFNFNDKKLPRDMRLTFPSWAVMEYAGS